MRRAVAWGCAVALVAALAAGAFAQWRVAPERVADSLNVAFGASPGFGWRAPDSATFSALPWPSLRLVGADLDDADGVALISAPRARLDLSLIALLSGRFVPTRAVLVSPTVTLDTDRPAFIGVAQGFAREPRALAPLASLNLSNGLIRVVSKSRGLDTLIENVSGRLDGLATGDRLRINLSAVWRDVPVAITGVLADPEAAAKAEPSRLEFALVSRVANLVFRGAYTRGDDANVEGDLVASVGSLAALTHLFGSPPPPFLASDDISISGKAKATRDALTLSDAALTSAGQTFEGALEIAEAGGRTNVSGTLAADSLALAALLGPPQSLVDPGGGWSAAPLAIAPPQGFDLDLRLSAANLDVYGHALIDAAASVIVKDGKLHANLDDATIDRGRLNGEASVERVEDDLKIRARAELADADFGLDLAGLGFPAVTGQGAARFAVETTGRSPAAAAAGLSGTASLEAADGAIAGLNLEEALRRGQRRPIDIDRDMRLGGTPFDRLEVSLALDRGVARIVKGEMKSRGMSADLAGAIDLSARTWDLTLSAAQTDAAGQQSEDAARLTLDVTGPWAAPELRAGGDKVGPLTGSAPSPLAP